MCNMDCLKCKYDDCIRDEITDDEISMQNELDKLIVTERQYTKQGRYNHTDKGRLARMRYNHSYKGKGCERRKTQNRVNSGKNAEKCRRYYYKKKLMLAVGKE